MSTRDNLEREAHAAKEKLGEAGDALKAQAHDAAEQAKSTAAAYAEQGVAAAGSSLTDFADAVRKAADKLGERDQGVAAKLVGQAADGLEQAANAVSGATLDDMMHSVQRFARANPAAFVGVAVLAGIALGRFARASAERSQTSDDWSSAPGYRSTGRDGYQSGGYQDRSGGGYGADRGRGAEPNRPTGGMAGTASAGRPMTPGTGPASGRATAAPASSNPKA